MVSRSESHGIQRQGMDEIPWNTAATCWPIEVIHAMMTGASSSVMALASFSENFFSYSLKRRKIRSSLINSLCRRIFGTRNVLYSDNRNASMMWVIAREKFFRCTAWLST